jgi:hypothetical protein
MDDYEAQREALLKEIEDLVQQVTLQRIPT